MSDSRNADDFKTIATIMVSESEGVLLVKPIGESNQAMATKLIQCLDNETAVRVPANGKVSVRKIIDLLSQIQEQE
jgi:biopolymer transport protein ExbD